MFSPERAKYTRYNRDNMKRVTLIVSIFLTLFVSPFVQAAPTEPLTEQHIAAIKSGCSDALQGLLQVQKTEAATRVNRGREYEALLKLVAAFNSRIVLNKLDAPVLTGAAAKLQTKFSSFQQHYLTYANKVDATLEVNCKTAPVTFYDNLTAARDARATLATDVREMDMLLDEYQKGLDALKVQLATLTPPENQP